MNEAAFRAEQLKSLHAAQLGEIESNAVITGIRLENGRYHVLSRYGDIIWILPDTLFPAGRQDSHKKLNFSRVPLAFQTAMRSFMVRYILVGIEGRIRPSGATIFGFFSQAASFLNWLSDRGEDSLTAITPLICQQYVGFCKELTGRKGQPLTHSALANRFLAVETLQILSLQSAEPMRHPWPEESALHLAGLTGKGNPKFQEAKTEIIPNTILGPLFRGAVEWLDRADEIITIRDQIEYWESQKRSQGFFERHLNKLGWTLGEAIRAEQLLQAACMCVILVTSGVRVSELCSLENQCWYSTQEDQSELLLWMKGISYKTGVGKCEWLVTDITCRAIDVAERRVSGFLCKQVWFTCSASGLRTG